MMLHHSMVGQAHGTYHISKQNQSAGCIVSDHINLCINQGLGRVTRAPQGQVQSICMVQWEYANSFLNEK